MERVRKGFGERRDNILVLLGSREITKTEDRNYSRIILLRAVSRILEKVVHPTLVLPRVVMG